MHYGGVLTAVLSGFKSNQLDIDSDVEELRVHIRAGARDLNIGCVYIPPRSDISVHYNHLKSVEKICEHYANCDITVIGDFNLQNIKWRGCDDTPEVLPFNVPFDSYHIFYIFHILHFVLISTAVSTIHLI